MQTTGEQENPDQVRDIIRSIVIPAGLATIAVGAGTAGYFVYLPTLAAYSDASTVELLIEGFFRSINFLVLGLGGITAQDTISYTLLGISRFFSIFFFSYAALAGIGLVFAEQLQPLRIELWSHLGSLPGIDDCGHVVVCGVGDDGYSLAAEALENGRNVVAIDIEHNDRLDDLEIMGAVTFEADAHQEVVLTNRAQIHLASEMFVTAGSDETNGAIVETIQHVASESDWPQVVDITTRIEDIRLRRTLHKEFTSTDGAHLRTYDEPEATARELLTAHPVDNIEKPNQRVHIWVVGWTPLSKAVVNQLFHLLHYPEAIERQITIITEAPADVEDEIAALFPGIASDWWDDESMSKFVEKLFPDIDVQSMPTSDLELLSDNLALYDTLKSNDKLTIIADDQDERSLRALISVWGPKLDELVQDLDLDATLLYRSSEKITSTDTTSRIQSFTFRAFGDGCSIGAVRGEDRDRIARNLALVYHLVYHENPFEKLPRSQTVPAEIGDTIESVMEWLESVSHTEREQCANAVWWDLPEYQRESNRHAADHAAVKLRMAGILSRDETTPSPQTIRAVAESEHRRWCAEKILDGWEPLPSEKMDQWSSADGEQALRGQRYHPDIRSVESLRAEMDGEWNKDVTQVKAVLDHPAALGYTTDN